jgi:hypothetical protein
LQQLCAAWQEVVHGRGRDLPRISARVHARGRIGDKGCDRHDHRQGPVFRGSREWGTAIYGGSPSKTATKFWALSCPASLRYARSRQAGPQKRDHGRAGRKSARMPRTGASRRPAAALPLYARLPAASPPHRPPAMKRIFARSRCRERPSSGGSLYRTRRNLRSPSLKVHMRFAASISSEPMVAAASSRAKPASSSERDGELC